MFGSICVRVCACVCVKICANVHVTLVNKVNRQLRALYLFARLGLRRLCVVIACSYPRAYLLRRIAAVWSRVRKIKQIMSGAHPRHHTANRMLSLLNPVPILLLQAFFHLRFPFNFPIFKYMGMHLCTCNHSLLHFQYLCIQ